MYYKSKEYLMKEYNISEKALALHEKAMEAVTPLF